MLSLHFCRTGAAAFTIYKDSTTTDDDYPQQPDVSKRELHSLHPLAARPERNKENNAIPGKWTAYRVGILKS